METEKDVDEFLAKYTPKQFLDVTDRETKFLDHRCQVIVNNLFIVELMDSLIIKKSLKCKKLANLFFSEKREILYKNGILTDNWNNELKIVNQIRNEFGHVLNPIPDKIPKIIKKSKIIDVSRLPKIENPVGQAGANGLIVGMITGSVMRFLAETLWETNSR